MPKPTVIQSFASDLNARGAASFMTPAVVAYGV